MQTQYGIAFCLLTSIYQSSFCETLEKIDPIEYLSNFGYLPSFTPNSKSNADNHSMVQKAVLNFQEFYGLEKSGLLDSNTIKLMNAPRCGVPDIFRTRQKRYADAGYQWSSRDLSYRVEKYSNKIDNETVDATLAKAFLMWEKVANIKFSHKETGDVTIDIRFEMGEHCPGENFTEDSTILAHAYFPLPTHGSHAGDIHFNDNINWTVGSLTGKDLLWHAVHEIGHSLGLGHSAVEDSVMHSFRPGAKDVNFTLNDEDITRIQELYGPPTEIATKRCLEKIQTGNRTAAVKIFNSIDKNDKLESFMLIITLAYEKNVKNFKGVINFIADVQFEAHLGLKMLFVLMKENNHIFGHSEIFSLAYHEYEYWKKMNKQPQLKQMIVALRIEGIPDIVRNFFWGENNITLLTQDVKWVIRTTSEMSGEYFNLENAESKYYLTATHKKSDSSMEFKRKMQQWKIIVHHDDFGTDWISIHSYDSHGCLKTIESPSGNGRILTLETDNLAICSKWEL